jgi:hypothetical protein
MYKRALTKTVDANDSRIFALVACTRLHSDRVVFISVARGVSVPLESDDFVDDLPWLIKHTPGRWVTILGAYQTLD